MKIEVGSCVTSVRCINEKTPIFVFNDDTQQTKNLLRGHSFQLSISNDGVIKATDSENQEVLMNSKCIPHTTKADNGHSLNFRFIQLSAANARIEFVGLFFKNK